MKASDLPTIKLPIPFGVAAVAPYIHQVPVESQIGIINGAASLRTGFVPNNFLTPGAGGVPPFGNDVNGILFEISAWTRWYNGGGAIFPYDAAFAIDISGYPKGAICSGTAGGTTFYISVVDDNLVNPTSAPGASWQVFGLGNSGVTAGAYAQANIIVGPDGRVTTAANGTLPTRTVIASGSGTYNTPAGARQLRVRMIAGGGGAGGITNNGTVGGTTSFGGITCIGGGPGLAGSTPSRAGGTGGTGGTGTASYRAPGSDGAPGTGTGGNTGGIGGSGPFGGAGQGGNNSTQPGISGKANTGAGGGGAGSSGTSGGGGASGEYAELIINAPAATYAYAVGAGGPGGTAAGVAGGDGGPGVIIIDEFY